MTRVGKKRGASVPTTGDNGGGEPEKLKLSQAHKFMGVSHAKITNLVGSGVLQTESDPLDRRVKLVRVSDLRALMSGRAAGAAGVEGGGK